jgi:YrbI family 3-deoxy-D-manno-octulosonate 8-phosphate phosphatase
MVSESIIRKSRAITVVVTDIDGVWTDGTMYYSPEGEALKAFSTYDGMGVELLRNQGIPTVIITGEDSPFTLRRAEKLNIDRIYTGVKKKRDALDALCGELSLTLDAVAYIGDDVNDLDILQCAGLSAMPSSSPILGRFTPDYITQRPGGKGAFREFADLILEAKQDQRRI